MSAGGGSETDDLRDLRDLWQTRPEMAPIDADALRASLRRRQRSTRLMMWLDALGVAVAGIIVVYVLATAPSTRLMVWAVFVVVLSSIAVAVSAVIRRRVWSVADASELGVAAMVDASVRQAQAALALIRLIYWVVGACFVFLAGWALTEYFFGEPLDPQSLRRRIVGYSVALAYGLAFVVGGAWKARRKRRELARLSAMSSALSGND